MNGSKQAYGNEEFIYPALELLVIQPTSFCNLDCTYCYVPNRHEKACLQIEVLERLFQLLSASSHIARQETLSILWHAGEPLTAGLDFFRTACELIARYFSTWPRISQAIQSNGVLIDDKWCDFFASNEITVGVSLDGPKDIHDSSRRRRNGKGSFEKVICGVELLKQHAIPTGALCVLTPKSIQQPARMFDFFVALGLENVAFNAEESEGTNTCSSLVKSYNTNQLTALYSSFMENFLTLNIKAGSPLRVREAQAVVQRIRHFREFGFPPKEAEQRLGAIITMTREGYLSSWSPELVSASTDQLSSLTLGNVIELTSIEQIFVHPNAIAVQSAIDRGIEMCRESCEYYAICGGGSPSNKFFENKTFASSQTVHCLTQIKAMTEVALARHFVR